MQLDRHNAWTTIRRAPSWFLDYLGRHLSVPVEVGTDPGVRFGALWTYEGQRYGTLLKGDRVPAGLTAHVEQLAQHYRLPVSLVDARVRPEDQMPLWSVTANWRPYQGQVHHQVTRWPCGVIDAPPRSGKTMMAARTIDTYNVPSVYIAPSVQIVRQTYEVFASFFGTDLVSRLDGSAAPHERDPEKRIVVATANSAVRMPREWWDARDLLVIDEFHHAAAETYHRINDLAANVYYRYGFTGTHFRTGDDRLAMEAVCSYLLHKIPVEYLVENDWLAAPHVFFIPVRTTGTGAADWRVAYQRGIVECDYRNELVVQTAACMAANAIPSIVLTKRRAHADALGERIPNSVVVKGGENALTSRSVREFLKGRYEVLIGTSVIGEGVDVPRAAALIYASGGADGVPMMQSYFRPLTAAPGKSVGRIYDFIDMHHGLLERHSRRRAEMARSQLGRAGTVIVP